LTSFDQPDGLQLEFKCVLGPSFRFAHCVLLELIFNHQLSSTFFGGKVTPPDSLVTVEFETASAQGRQGMTLRVANAVGSAGVPDGGKVFHRYYRSEGARRQVGAGLGLWLAQALAQQLGTELQFRSDPTQVVFSLFLESA
jgi:hypothetical protein